MVAEQIAARGIRSPAVLRAMGAVRRERFVPRLARRFAYDDGPLAIGGGQTISQPYVVALMIASAGVESDERVLEIGTGSGYGAAVLGAIAHEVHTVERLAPLAEKAARRLADEGFDNVHVHVGDGTVGRPEDAPFDAILVTAAGPRVPTSLLAQLAPGGRLVMPVGEDPELQRLVRVTRAGEDRFEREDLGAVRFVPLIGAEGWDEP